MSDCRAKLSTAGYCALLELVAYGRQHNFFAERDITYIHNRLLCQFGVSDCPEPATAETCERPVRDIENILEDLLLEAEELELIPRDSIANRDLFDTELMGVMMPRPSEVSERFQALAAEDVRAATDYYYDLSLASNYIRRQRVAKDLRWQVDSEYGTIDISINRSKPEKDPRAIAAAGKVQSTAYPKCLLCAENEGYRGSLTQPARSNHRLIDLVLDDERWFLQYSPYVYYNEHCIFLHSHHHPMKIDRSCFRKLLAIVELLPHYFVGSNADLPIVGGSILSHEHFQGGRYQFAMERAPLDSEVEIADYSDITVGWVKWPLSVLRLRGADAERITDLADQLLRAWRVYTDAEAGIYAESGREPHNTITPIARRRGEDFELDLVLRNNRTDTEHPWGIYHPREEYHHIKKENIGLIEVMGLAVLPARLSEELEQIASLLESYSGEELSRRLAADPLTQSHSKWVNDLLTSGQLRSLARGTVEDTDISDESKADLRRELKQAVGEVFVKVLEDAGVYKRDNAGIAARDRFIESFLKDRG